MTTALQIQLVTVIDKLTDQLLSKVRLVPYQREVDSVIKELKNLEELSRDKRRVKILSREDWQFQCLKVVFQVEDIVDTFLIQELMLQKRPKRILKIKKVRPLISLTSIWTQLHFDHELKLASKHLTDLLLKVKDIDGDHDGPPAPAASAGASSSKDDGENDLSDIVGFEEETKKLCSGLITKYGSFLVVALTGMAGSGKTTVARMVFNREETKKHFMLRAWVQVPRGSYDLSYLLERIIEQFSSTKLEEEKSIVSSSPDELKKRLEELIGRHKFLIVFDDIWDSNFWVTVRDAIPSGRIGSVLLISQNSYYVSYATQSHVEVHRLSDDDSWKLFLKKVHTTEDEFNKTELSQNVYLKEKILRKCDGLPLAIVILGNLLSTKQSSQSEWFKVIDDPSTFAQSSFFSFFESNFDQLTLQLKRCFLYMSLFPRASDIHLKRLYRLWIAEGFMDDYEKHHQRTPEDLAGIYIAELFTVNLLEVTEGRSLTGPTKKCRIPGLMYDFIQAKSMDLGYAYVHHRNFYYDNIITRSSFAPNVRRLVQYSDIKNYLSVSVPDDVQSIRSYISFDTRKRDGPTLQVGVFLNRIMAKRGFGLLRVIDLECVYKPVLPETIGKLFLHLRYLGLRWTFLDSLPASVGDLPYLETLDVKHTNITNLPSSIWKAKNLRHFYVNEVHVDTSIQLGSSSGSLANLQTLWGLVIGINSPMVNGLQSLTNLRKLGVTCHPEPMKAVIDSISHLKDLKSLRLRSVDEYGLPSNLELGDMREHSELTDLYLLGVLPKALNLEQLPKGLRVLTLSVSNLTEDPMPILGNMGFLNVLKLYGRSYLGKKMTCLAYSFNLLKVLKIWKLENLEEWNIENGALSWLQELEIRCCNRLKVVSGLKGRYFLDLTLTSMPEDLVKNIKACFQGSDSRVVIKENKWVFADASQDGM
ncbi:Disease resistance protein [Quillaja saponaria]|uniref:Disease resistance protein n=1 Tax=Quillaja saponaria TaxID=32244 RepID=A0AAD7M669_QUISA|nr:Disease resistance protein [Quillaja saponaria]